MEDLEISIDVQEHEIISIISEYKNDGRIKYFQLKEDLSLFYHCPLLLKEVLKSIITRAITELKNCDSSVCWAGHTINTWNKVCFLFISDREFFIHSQMKVDTNKNHSSRGKPFFIAEKSTLAIYKAYCAKFGTDGQTLQELINRGGFYSSEVLFFIEEGLLPEDFKWITVEPHGKKEKRN